MNERGSLALVRTKKKIYTLHLADGRVIQAFQPASKKWNRNPSTDEMFLSPDARVVATWAEPPENIRDGEAAVTFQDAETAAVLSVAPLQHDVNVRFNLGIFTSRGDALLLPGTCKGKPCVEALAVASGERKVIPLPTPQGSGGLPEILLPLPDAYGFLAAGGVPSAGKNRAAPVAILDLIKGERHPQPAIDIAIFHGIYDRRLEISVTGQFALAQDTGQSGMGQFELGDLWNDKQLTNVAGSMASFDTACFTPDGQRFIMEWVPHFKMSHYDPTAPNLSHSDRVLCRLELYESAPPRLVAECEVPTYVRTMAISADGRVLAWANGTNVYTMDFKSAFGVDPLPPATCPSVSFAER